MEQQGTSIMDFQNAAHSPNLAPAFQLALIWPKQQPPIFVQTPKKKIVGLIQRVQKPQIVWMRSSQQQQPSIPKNVIGYRSSPPIFVQTPKKKIVGLIQRVQKPQIVWMRSSQQQQPSIPKNVIGYRSSPYVPRNVTGFRSTPSTLKKVGESKDQKKDWKKSPSASFNISLKVKQNISKLVKIAPKNKTYNSSPNELAVLYVNPKQYARILIRRRARTELAVKWKIPSGRQKYLYESRHKHAMSRIRENRGRFVSDSVKFNTSISIE